MTVFTLTASLVNWIRKHEKKRQKNNNRNWSFDEILEARYKIRND